MGIENKKTGIVEEQYDKESNSDYKPFSRRRDKHPKIFTGALRKAGLIGDSEQVVDVGVDMVYFSESGDKTIYSNNTVLEAFSKHKGPEGYRNHLFSLNGHKEVRWVEVPEKQSFFRSVLTSVDYVPDSGCKIYILVAKH